MSSISPLAIATALTATIASLTTAQGDSVGPKVLIVGPDSISCLQPAIASSLSEAGFQVTQLETVDDIETTDLSEYEAVWLPNGIDEANTFCSGDNPIPSPAATEQLKNYLLSGGGVYFAGETGSVNQTSFLIWRDTFISDTLGGGEIDGVCNCSLGSTIYLSSSHSINNTPAVLENFSVGTSNTGGFEQTGNATPIAWGNPSHTGLPVGLLWDNGDLTLAPSGRVVVINNSNNSSGFETWAINAMTFLTQSELSCPADLTGEYRLNFFDVAAFLEAYAVGDPIADFTNDGEFNFFDVAGFLDAYLAGCP